MRWHTGTQRREQHLTTTRGNGDGGSDFQWLTNGKTKKNAMAIFKKKYLRCFNFLFFPVGLTKYNGFIMAL